MNNSLKILLTLFVFNLIGGLAMCQEGSFVEIRDFETWNSLGFKYKADSEWVFGLSQDFRLNNNSSSLEQYFTELDAKYKGWENWGVGAGFRFIRNNDLNGETQGFENHSRWNLDLSYKHKLERLSLSYRLRFQSKNEWGISKAEGDYPDKDLRLKIGANYNIKKWKLDPEFSTEIFRHYEHGEQNGFNKFRLTVGTDYNIKKVGKVKIFYRMQKELNRSYPKTTNILGFSFVYTLKSKSND